jgi:hypothetical protein
VLVPPAREEEPANRRLGDFQVVRELGRGGMGVVFEARQLSLNRKVALKVLYAGLGVTSTSVARFHREAEAAARLHHSNIVPVYATGEHDGTHFYAMELIDGPSLDHFLKRLKTGSGSKNSPQMIATPPAELVQTAPYVEGSSSTASGTELSTTPLFWDSAYFDSAARMIADVADALEHAHKNGVIHRDIKPSNLLLSPDGRLSVNDFGLARLLEQPGMTMTGEFVGTPAYMSPEQIAAGRTPLDHRTDIYSLGTTLYELLTLCPPFAGERRDQVLAQILHKEPKPPRRVNKKVPVDLETVCLKAMEKDPDRRYQTAGRMAEDLRRYVNRFAITARRAGPAERVRKWVRRHPGLTAGLAFALLASAAAAAFAHRAHRFQQQGLADKERLSRELQTERRQAAVDKAILEAMNGDLEAASLAIADAERLGAEPGQLNLLRGAVGTYSGSSKEALRHLELAVKQLPESAAVNALLAWAYQAEGQWQRFIEMSALLEHLDPKTPEDHLFLALGQALTDPKRGLQTLDGAPAHFRQSTLARLARATAKSVLAQMTGTAEDAEQALDDLRMVDLPEGVTLCHNRVLASLVAAHAYRAQPARRDAVLMQARDDVQRLANYADNPLAILTRCYYYLTQEDDEKLLRIIREAKERRAANSYVVEIEATVLFRRNQDEEAWRVLQANEIADPVDCLIDQGIVLLAMPGRKEDAARAFTTAIRNLNGGSTLGWVSAYLQLLGPPEQDSARQSAVEIRQRSSHLIPNLRDRWYHDLLAFHAGLIDADRLLEKAGRSPLSQCEAYYYIGLQNVAAGKRGQAKENITRAIETGVFTSSEYIWGRALLPRLDDPAWLPWIPVKK